MCMRLQNRGQCLLVDMCMFAHSEAQLGTVALVIDDRVKTEICRKWENGKCVFGKYCPSAHGMEQIGRLKPPEEICRMCGPINKKPNRGGEERDKPQDLETSRSRDSHQPNEQEFPRTRDVDRKLDERGGSRDRA